MKSRVSELVKEMTESREYIFLLCTIYESFSCPTNDKQMKEENVRCLKAFTKALYEIDTDNVEKNQFIGKLIKKSEKYIVKNQMKSEGEQDGERCACN